ncbi:MAG: DUF4157 domain-containing protein [Anaerolineae bacterium]|nr:DUF4157 domain-containing protein [Anaerolineae bacterium]
MEADRVADHVMRMPTPPASLNREEDATAVARSSILNRYLRRAALQRAEDGVGGNAVDDGVQSRIETMQHSGQPLPESEREFFEPRMGVDLGGVRTHAGDDATQTSQDLNARAYTVGSHIAFNSGEYQPRTVAGRRLLAHELTHVVQQGGAGELRRLQRTQSLVQRAPSDYKSKDDIKAMKLTAFDRYAHSQADWAISSTLGTDKESLRSLLALARMGGGLVLGACGSFSVQSLYDLKAGQGKGSTDDDLTAYSRAASIGKNAGTIHIEAPAATAAEAVKWGAALRKLETGIGGLIIERVIPQDSGREKLKALVDAGAVDEFVKYYQDVKPLLDADNGAEIVSYLAFRTEGGQGKYAGYQTSLPEIRNYHRFTVPQLDALATNRANAQNNATLTNPLPISVVLQTALDHNGAFHRDPNMTAVINRTTHITLVAEGRVSLAAFSSDLATFAKYGKDGKVDEVMISGHGNAKGMQLAGDKGISNSSGKPLYGTSKGERLSVDNKQPSGLSTDTDKFISSIKSVLRDDPNSRIVLNACLTASNSVDNVTLDPDPVKAAKQIKTAIASDPSLATAIKTKLGAYKGKVLGANASFGQVSLLDPGGNIDIISSGDPKLTASKLEYAEAGVEPTGVLRAVLESWANNKQDTIDALKRRIKAKASDKSWSETLITALAKIIVADPDNAPLIRAFVDAAGALGHMTSRSHCNVKSLKGKVPDAHMDAIFTALGTSGLWTNTAYNFVPAVVYQVWIEKKNGKIGDFLTFLDGSTFNTSSASSVLDLDHLRPLLGKLLPAPSTPNKPPRGSFLIALLYLVKEGTKAPQAGKDYIKTVVGTGNQVFPSTSNVADILKGANQQNVLEDAGVIQKPTGTQQSSGTGSKSNKTPGPEPNVAPTGAGANTLAVESVTMKCKTYGWFDTTAYMLPKGNKIGTIPDGTELNIIGKAKGPKQRSILPNLTNVDFFAVDHTIGSNKTVFVVQSDVKVIS